MGVVSDGRLKLVLQKQRDTIVRVVPTAGQGAIKALTPDILFFFTDRKNTYLGQSSKKPGEVMHEKAWIAYINREMKKVKDTLPYGDAISSHSFRVDFVTRHLKHADIHEVSKLIGHKNIHPQVQQVRCR